MKQTQNEIIKNYLFEAREHGDGWVLGGTIRSKETNGGFIGFRGDRDARNLYEKKKYSPRWLPKKTEEKNLSGIDTSTIGKIGGTRTAGKYRKGN